MRLGFYGRWIFLWVIVWGGAVGSAVSSAQNTPKFQEGDIIFRTSRSRQSRAICLATASFYSHVGIITRQKSEWYVIEAVGSGVGQTRLKDWIGYGWRGYYTVMRYPDLTPSLQKKLIQAAKSYFGRPYDPLFLFGNREVYCSELVYLVFKSAGIELGKVEKVGSLYVNNSVVRSLAEERMKNHPLFKDKDGEESWQTLMEQELITPASLAHDKKLRTIYSNYPL